VTRTSPPIATEKLLQVSDEHFSQTGQYPAVLPRTVSQNHLALSTQAPPSGNDSLLLFPERYDVLLKPGYVVDAMKPDTYRGPFRKHTVKLAEDIPVARFLLQFNLV